MSIASELTTIARSIQLLANELAAAEGEPAEPTEEPQFEDVRKAATIEQARREDMQYDFVCARGWYKVCTAPDGSFLQPVLMQHPDRDGPPILTEQAFLIEKAMGGEPSF